MLQRTLQEGKAERGRERGTGCTEEKTSREEIGGVTLVKKKRWMRCEVDEEEVTLDEEIVSL